MTYGELIETELEQSPEAAAETLREIANDIAAGGEITIESGDDSVTVQGPKEAVELEIEVEREPEDEGIDEIELEIELEWEVATEEAAESEDESEPDDSLEIE